MKQSHTCISRLPRDGHEHLQAPVHQHDHTHEPTDAREGRVPAAEGAARLRGALPATQSWGGLHDLRSGSCTPGPGPVTWDPEAGVLRQGVPQREDTLSRVPQRTRNDPQAVPFTQW